MISKPRKLVESTLIKSQKRRATQQIRNRTNPLIDKLQNGCQITYHPLKNRRNTLLCSLKSKAKEVVPLKKSLGVVNSPRNISGVDAYKSMMLESSSEVWNEF